MRIFFCLISLIKLCGWFVGFVLLMLVYDAVTDIVGSNMFRTKKPAVYPTEERTAFLLDPPGACTGVQSFDALVVVHSATDHFRHRQDYRDTYGNSNFTRPYRLKVLFFLGLPTEASLQTELVSEHLRHRDTVQANFTDTYHNLAFKAVAVLRWLNEKCPEEPRMIVKMDDDVLLDVARMFEELVTPAPYHNDFLVHCHVWEAAEAERRGKWRLSRREYPLDTFPDYCSGFLVILQKTAVEELYYTALETPILWVDDVYIYGVVRQKTQDIQVLYLDHVAYSEKLYKACVRHFGYRCKYWATTLDLSPQSYLVPALLSLQADRVGLHTPLAVGGGACDLKSEKSTPPLESGSTRPSHGCSPTSGTLQRRRELERRRVGTSNNSLGRQ